MPRIKTGSSGNVDSSDPIRVLLPRLRAGRVIPIISNQLILERLVGHISLAHSLVDRLGYPSLNKSASEPTIALVIELRRMMTSDPLAVNEEYLDFIKSLLLERALQDTTINAELVAALEERFDMLTVTQLARELNIERSLDPQLDPLRLLAEFPLPIYLTSSHHGLMEEALRMAGKEPYTMICPWKEALADLADSPPDSDLAPSPQRPLVFHFLGLDNNPDSLVLTADDMLQFLTSQAVDQGRYTDTIPRRIRQGLSDSSLLLLGYTIDAWECKSLFYGPLADRARLLTSLFVCTPPSETSKAWQAYAEAWLSQWETETYWGHPSDFLSELYKAWNEDLK
ncbi:MAG: SIR2 family protein [Caldilineaceae bacterium]